MNLQWRILIITTVLYDVAVADDGDRSTLARVHYRVLDNGTALQLTITPLNGNISNLLIGNSTRRRGPDVIHLRVERDTKFDDSFPVIVDGEKRDDLRKDVGFYTADNKTSISVLTDRTKHKRVRRFAEGEFYYRSRQYQLRRAPDDEFHFLTERAAELPYGGDTYWTAPSAIGLDRLDRTRRQVKKAGPYYIELAVFTDVSVFLHMSRRAKRASKEQVIKNIHHRVGHIIHGVDLAYRRMKTVDMSIWLRALYVSTEYLTSLPITISALDAASKPRWNDPHPRKNCRADANKVRVNVNKWLSEQPFHADHAMSFTMYDLWDMKDKIDVVGQSDYANMCGPEKWRSSCVEWGSFHIWATAAHELAHNLNVAHDGQESSRGCDTKQYFLMTTDSVYHDRSTINNGFRFSDCTERSIRETMAKNEREGRNCLGNKVKAHLAALNAHLETHLPGQEYSLMKQCQIVYGQKSKPCVRVMDIEEICIILYCTNPATNKKGCENPGDFRAAMGTPCGNKKWCYEGKCVSNPRARTFNPTAASKHWVNV